MKEVLISCRGLILIAVLFFIASFKPIGEKLEHISRAIQETLPHHGAVLHPFPYIRHIHKYGNIFVSHRTPNPTFLSVLVTAYQLSSSNCRHASSMLWLSSSMVGDLLKSMIFPLYPLISGHFILKSSISSYFPSFSGLKTYFI